MKSLKILAAALLLAGSLAGPALADTASDDTSVRALMMQTFDRPDSPLKVDPITVDGDIAVAGWSQGDMGGRALLRRKDGHWVLVLCSGDALKDPKGLQTFGLPEEQAKALAIAIVAAEAKLDAALVAKFSTFDGVVTMGEDGQHPPAAGHDGHDQHSGGYGG